MCASVNQRARVSAAPSILTRIKCPCRPHVNGTHAAAILSRAQQTSARPELTVISSHRRSNSAVRREVRVEVNGGISLLMTPRRHGGDDGDEDDRKSALKDKKELARG